MREDEEQTYYWQIMSYRIKNICINSQVIAKVQSTDDFWNPSPQLQINQDFEKLLDFLPSSQ